MSTEGSKLSVFAAIVANVLIAILKFIASFFTGSSAMLSEGIHSLIDSVNGLLLILGINRSHKKPDKMHPFGHGKEVYFWSFIVSILVFSLGGGVAIYEGIHRILHPTTENDSSNVIWNYGVLLGAMLFEGTSLFIGLRQFRKIHPHGFKSALEESKDTASVAIIVEETGALAGLFIALIGVTLSHFTHNPIFDAASSIAIGVLLVYIAYFMATETKHLLIGETATEEDIMQIENILLKNKKICSFGDIKTMHMGPEEVIAGIKVDFKDSMPVGELEGIIEKIKSEIKQKKPKFKYVYIEAHRLQNSN